MGVLCQALLQRGVVGIPVQVVELAAVSVISQSTGTREVNGMVWVLCPAPGRHQVGVA